MTRPIPDSYWVVPGRLLAGEYPCSIREDEARRKIGALLDAGIRSFVDLTETDDGLRQYDQLALTLAHERGVEVRHRRFSIPDRGVPAPALMSRILAHIDSEMSGSLPTYVHCWGGIGRTGTVVGCYLVTKEGLTGEEAIERIAELRRGCPDGRRPSPETSEQWQFVVGWPARQSSAHMSLRQRCDALLRFEGMFDGPVPFATVPPWGRNEEDSGVVPFPNFSPWASEFVQAIYDAGWCVPFDWTAWRDEAFAYVERPELLRDADLDVITKLLTAHVRADRFNDGHLAEMAERGHLKAILGRLRELRDQADHES